MLERLDRHADAGVAQAAFGGRRLLGLGAARPGAALLGEAGLGERAVAELALVGLGVAEGPLQLVERDFARAELALQHLVDQRADGDVGGGGHRLGSRAGLGLGLGGIAEG